MKMTSFFVTQADLVGQDPTNVYVAFGVILFIWEFLPTFILIMFFRVRSPEGTLVRVKTVTIICFLKTVIPTLI